MKKTIDEAEKLSSQLVEISPFVTQQFVIRLISGNIASTAEFKTLTNYIDIDFTKEYTTALYLVFQENMLEQAILLASRFNIKENATIIFGTLANENALCAIINFDISHNELDTFINECAQQLYAYFQQNNISPKIIGIGSAYGDPMKMNESFTEACVAVQLAPNNMHIWHYSKNVNITSTTENMVYSLSPQMLSLLSESIRRGDLETAQRALNELMNSIMNAAHSAIFFRFFSAELLAEIIRLSDSLHLPIDMIRVHQVITIQSPEEFLQNISELITNMCVSISKRINDEKISEKEKLLKYIRLNFKRSDLSIQMVADETKIQKAQITALIKEETGQGFVQYISYLRHNEFKRMLITSDDTIHDLVMQIGYNDVPNFLRKFKMLEGLTPSQYRQQYRQ